MELSELLQKWALDFAALNEKLKESQCLEVLNYIISVESEADRYKNALYKVLTSPPEQYKKICKKELGYK